MKHAMLVLMFGLAAGACTAIEQRMDGTAMIAPPGSTRDENLRRVHECDMYAKADLASGQVLTDAERAPLQGRSTTMFYFHGHPAVNHEYSPLLRVRVSGHTAGHADPDLSDRYALCLMARGFTWPDTHAPI